MEEITKNNLKQLQKLRSITRGTDVTDQTKKITDRNFNGTNGANYRNPIDGYVDSWSDFVKNHRKYTANAQKLMKLESYSEFIKENVQSVDYYKDFNLEDFPKEINITSPEAIKYEFIEDVLGSNKFTLRYNLVNHDKDNPYKGDAPNSMKIDIGISYKKDDQSGENNNKIFVSIYGGNREWWSFSYENGQIRDINNKEIDIAEEDMNAFMNALGKFSNPLNETISRKVNIDQMKKLRDLTKGTDVADQMSKMNKKYYNGTNGAVTKNAFDTYIDSWEDHMKKERKRLNKMKTKVHEGFTKELEMGVEVEKEHKDVYDYLKSYLEENGLEMPLTLDEFSEKIAKAHLKELKDYYTRLMDMEKSAELHDELGKLKERAFESVIADYDLNDNIEYHGEQDVAYIHLLFNNDSATVDRFLHTHKTGGYKGLLKYIRDFSKNAWNENHLWIQGYIAHNGKFYSFDEDTIEEISFDDWQSSASNDIDGYES